ncbi:J domain-containing protein, partial [Candidatus Halobonum tyrrellensis]
ARERAGAGGRAGSPAGGAGMSRPEAYSELDLSPEASGEEVKRAYRERVKETHPDSGGDEEEFKRVTSAYETLTEAGS